MTENKYFTSFKCLQEDDIRDLFNNITNKPDTVFHYTSRGSLYSILENNCIFFGNILRSNDPLEIKFGLETISHILNENSDKNETCGLKNLICDIFNDQEFANENFFALAASQNGDMYQQWVNYADKGKGVSIELFRTAFLDKIKEFIKENGYFFYVYPVQYYTREFEYKNTDGAAIGDFENRIYGICKKLNSELSSGCIKEIKNMLFILSSLIKNDFHKDEKEWRYFILSQDQNDTNMRKLLTNEGLKKIYCFNFKDIGVASIIKTIKLGPHVSNYDDKDKIKNDLVEYIETKLPKENGRESRVTSSRGRIQ